MTILAAAALVGTLLMVPVLSSLSNSFTLMNSGSITAQQFHSGWENSGGSDVTDGNKWTGKNGAPTVASNPTYSGSYAMHTNTELGNVFLNVTPTNGPLDASCFVRYSSLPSTTGMHTWVIQMDKRTTLGYGIQVRTTRQADGNTYFSFLDGNTATEITITNVQVLLEMWYNITLEGVNGVGCKLWINGVLEVSDGTWTSGSPISIVTFGGTQMGANQYIDDVIVGFGTPAPIVYPFPTPLPVPAYSGEQALPLHTNGKDICYPNGTKMVLRGVWDGMFADTSTGYFGMDVTKFDEAALNYTLDQLRTNWGANCINTFVWGNWIQQDWNGTLGGNNQTDIGLNEALVRTAQVCSAHGMYFQIRLYGTNSTMGGRVQGLPWYPYNYTGPVDWTPAQFTQFWVSMAQMFKNTTNVILTLFDEPTSDVTTPNAESVYFNVCNTTIGAMRNAGFNGLICVHWGYSGDVEWIHDWVNAGYTKYNIIFSEHIYYSGASYAWNANAPVDIDFIRNFLNTDQSEPLGTATNNNQYTCNVPIWVSAIGCDYGVTNDQEYIAFANTLQALNEFGIGYCEFTATRSTLEWTPLLDPTGQIFSGPNRVGQALINAIAGKAPPPVYYLTVTSPSAASGLIANMTDMSNYSNSYQVSFTQPVLAGTYTISMPSQVDTYTHHPLQANSPSGIGDFGGLATGRAGSFSSFLYTAGPYQVISGSQAATTIYLHTYAAGNAKVALYAASQNQNYPTYPSGMYYPSTLLASTLSQSCQANSWTPFTIPTTNLQNGTWYFLAMKGDTNNMFGSGSQKNWFGDYISTTYDSAFPTDFGTILGGLGTEFSIYLAAQPMLTTPNNFLHWENGSTNPIRTITVNSNMTIAAYYQ